MSIDLYVTVTIGSFDCAEGTMIFFAQESSSMEGDHAIPQFHLYDGAVNNLRSVVRSCALANG